MQNVVTLNVMEPSNQLIIEREREREQNDKLTKFDVTHHWLGTAGESALRYCISTARQNGLGLASQEQCLNNTEIHEGFFNITIVSTMQETGNTKGGSITVPLISQFEWFGISSMTTENFCFYLHCRLIQTSQTGGQLYSDTSPFSIPCRNITFTVYQHCMYWQSQPCARVSSLLVVLLV